jgi:hypothetical protein
MTTPENLDLIRSDMTDILAGLAAINRQTGYSQKVQDTIRAMEQIAAHAMQKAAEVMRDVEL